MLGERLALLRRRDHVSQKELGKEINVSHYTISSYEKGRSEPNDEIKVRIARYFNVSLDYLAGLIDEPLSYLRDAGVVALPRYFTQEQKELLCAFLHSLEPEPRRETAQARKSG